MIYYFDLRKPPIFSDMFRKSGVVRKNHYRSMTAMRAMVHRHIARAPSAFFYSKPRFRKGDDKIIVFDSYTDGRFLRWLCRRYPDKRIIFWFWNRISGPDRLKKIPPQVEIWSFSRADCRRYSLKYNTQFFFDCLAPLAKEYRGRTLPAETDSSHISPAEACGSREPSRPPRAFFLGRDKGRSEVLQKLSDELREAGAEVELRIHPDLKGEHRGPREKLLPYEKTVELLKDADILLDYANDPDTGLSMRCMEALFFNKKLITNNREILEADFYDPANVYVLEEDGRTLKEFLGTPVRPADPEIRDRYLLSRWIGRFDTEGEPL